MTGEWAEPGTGPGRASGGGGGGGCCCCHGDPCAWSSTVCSWSPAGAQSSSGRPGSTCRTAHVHIRTYTHARADMQCVPTHTHKQNKKDTCTHTHRQTDSLLIYCQTVSIGINDMIVSITLPYLCLRGLLSPVQFPTSLGA